MPQKSGEHIVILKLFLRYALIPEIGIVSPSICVYPTKVSGKVDRMLIKEYGRLRPCPGNLRRLGGLTISFDISYTSGNLSNDRSNIPSSPLHQPQAAAFSTPPNAEKDRFRTIYIGHKHNMVARFVDITNASPNLLSCITPTCRFTRPLLAYHFGPLLPSMIKLTSLSIREWKRG
ncbi:uncharacterized protein BT62DRAFT_1011533 [Guyanagaster necrorhizus]|uniref:Uncharacterized protein n=1 Tax=Guyanagaster necrorhizus TaxID=856835 RepID=A0A9P8AN50_9AGAR|nr:uncharacterized protein BT62DRAFT_1011533 [Guyanagaster necrorhizus MCA 3950]KAG7441515.1 hypothetical protein BT62DRAFT_1011533 [Guyanagaster necrorhizus MCA 3950]